MTIFPILKIGIWNAWTFMSIFIIQMIVILFYKKRVRKGSHIPDDERKTSLEKYISFLSNLIWLLALGYSIFLPLLCGTFWFYIGFFTFIFGTLFLSFSTYSFITASANQLIQKGIYKYSRHPMYLATFMIWLGSGIATASWILIILSVMLAICLGHEAGLEERYCQRIYEDHYIKYMDRVPRWFGMPKKM